MTSFSGSMIGGVMNESNYPALPKLNTEELAEKLRKAANQADRVENARKILEEAEKSNANGLIF